MLTPIELLDRLAALIAPPRGHRHRAPSGCWDPIHRCAPPHVAASASTRMAQAAEEPNHRQARHAWALLLARVYELFPLLCPKCGGGIRITAFLTPTLERLTTFAVVPALANT